MPGLLGSGALTGSGRGRCLHADVLLADYRTMPDARAAILSLRRVRLSMLNASIVG
ncbi:MAG TPA: hypothetical protein VIX82_11200 [Solirubrobacteraceae bacterium]